MAKKKPKKPLNRTIHYKKALLEALEACRCIVTDACKVAGVTRNTYYDYYNSDEEWKAAVDELANVALDFAESKLFQKMNGVVATKVVAGEAVVYDLPPSDTALIFYLKTKGRKRGYIEKDPEGDKDKPIPEVKINVCLNKEQIDGEDN